MHERKDLKALSKKIGKLPTLPGVAIKILQAMQRETPNIAEIAQAISADAPLSAKVLKAVNSPFYGLSNKITSVHQAMVFLGLHAVKNLALSFSLLSGFAPKRKGAFDYVQFSKDAIVGAVAARTLTKAVNRRHGENAFFLGLLQDIGTLILAESMPHEYAGYKVSPSVTGERFSQALDPRHVAISLSGEPTLYPNLPELIDLLTARGFSTFLVSNGTSPWILKKCRPFQLYVSLSAPDHASYLKICRPLGDFWENIRESLALLGDRRSAVRITLVQGLNTFMPERYGQLLQDSGARYVEVKGYMYLGYSRKRLNREHMPEHHRVKSFAAAIEEWCDYRITDENPASRVVLLERVP